MTAKKILAVTLVVAAAMYSFTYGQDKKETAFDRSAFYHAMSSSSIGTVDQELDVLKTSAFSGREAFEGALTMKKAGLAGNPEKKLSLFKSGHKKLEAAIQGDSTNVEFRFLRLMIQEHAPGILGYKKDLNKDSDYIRKHYKTLPPVVQERVIDYSKKSSILKLGDS